MDGWMEVNGSGVFKGREASGCAVSRGSRAADALLMRHVGRMWRPSGRKTGEGGGAGSRAQRSLGAGATCRQTKAEFVADCGVFGPLCF